jgi:hypothetical protein
VYGIVNLFSLLEILVVPTLGYTLLFKVYMVHYHNYYIAKSLVLY